MASLQFGRKCFGFDIFIGLSGNEKPQKMKDGAKMDIIFAHNLKNWYNIGILGKFQACDVALIWITTH